MIEIVITGNIPSKKNMLKLRAGGGGYYDPEVRAALNDITAQVESQWCGMNARGSRVLAPPLRHPAMAVVFYVVSERSDNDNKWTTVLDALVAGGVLKDDCIADCNGMVLICSSVKTPSAAGAKVYVEPSGDFDRLYTYVKQQDFESYDWLKEAKVKKSKGLRRI